MHPFVTLGLLALLSLPTPVQQGEGESPPDTLQAQGKSWGATPLNFEALRDHVIPKPSELRWRTIPWRTTLTLGFRDAAAEEKPLLLWAMNGHPLGST